MDTPYGLKALADEFERVATAGQGGRNDTLNVATFKAAQLIPADLAEETVRAKMRTAAKICGLDPVETERTINSAIPKGMANPRVPAPRADVAPERPKGGVWTQHFGPAEVDAVEAADETPFVDWSTFWTTDYEERWLIEPFIADGAQTVLYSAPKVGKSLLALELAAALATGGTALSDQVQPARVLYVDHENRLYGDVRPRLEAMGYTPSHDMERLAYWSFPRMDKLDTGFGADQLMRAIKQHRADLVILDTVSRVITGEENANDTWLNLYTHTGRRLKADGVALLRLDHSGKDVERGQRGGSAKSGDVDMVWRLDTVVDGKTYKLICEASRMQNDAKELVIHRETVDGKLRHRVDAMGWRGAKDARMASLLTALKASGSTFNVVGANLYLKDAGIKFDKNNVSRAWLQSNGLYAAS